MYPLMPLRNLTPSSTAAASLSDAFVGTDDGGQMLLGQLVLLPPRPSVTLTPFEAVSGRPLSSIARLRVLAVPLPPVVHGSVQLVVPAARFQVVPASAETSTP